MMTTAQALITVFICAAVTVLIRASAFLLFPAGKQAPAFITWMAKQLPRAVMAKSMPVRSKGSSCPISEPSSEPMIQ